MTYATADNLPPIAIAPAPVYFPDPLDPADTIASWSSSTGWTGRAADRRRRSGSRGGRR
jgi:hypothetical protein